MSVPFNNSYVQLPERFYSRQSPTKVKKPELIRANPELAQLLGIDPEWLSSDDGIATMAGNLIPNGADPIATVYAGHQFGSWNPQLGDGRAILLGEVIGTDRQRYDLQLKGAGQTPYSRMGDGRAPLGPVMREYIVSEAMAALGVQTSRSLAAVMTGESVYREETLPGAVLTRVAKSHIRIGTFQFFASKEDKDALGLLVDHVIGRHYPDSVQAGASLNTRALTLLDEVMRAQAKLVASWQMIGFIHGVMNTDNVLLSGETIDYGPCAFMDTYNPETVFSSIDHGGRYAYRNQPSIAHWNMACLAQSLVLVLDDKQERAIEIAKEALDKFPEYFLDANISGMQRKLGLAERHEGDEILAKEFLDLLETHQLDFTLSFRRLSELSGSAPTASVSSLAGFPSPFDSWMTRWNTRLETEVNPTRQQDMLRTNPAIIPRNHLIEESIVAASTEGDFDLFNELIDNLATPFDLTGVDVRFARKPKSDQVVRQTFCGT